MYITKNGVKTDKAIVLDDMILTKDMPTTAGSRMLEGYKSLFNATVVEKLTDAGYEIAGKSNVGEFAIDVIGETSYFGAVKDDQGNLSLGSAEILKKEKVKAAIQLDVNGSPRRASAVSGLVFVKPTYGTVSRYGTVPVACSGETVGVMAKSANDCLEVLEVISGYDAKDGTSLPADMIEEAGEIKRVAVVTAFDGSIDDGVKADIDAFVKTLEAKGVAVEKIDGAGLLASKTAWNILMSAELCNNVSRYDGVKYGYRTSDYTTIDELYTNSRTEAFGDLLKTAILYGSETLSDENYMKVYDKALRVRRVTVDYFDSLFENYDAVLMPATSKKAYGEADVKDMAYEENLYTAPASITGLPAVVAEGVQLVGKVFSEKALLELVKLCKEGE